MSSKKPTNTIERGRTTLQTHKEFLAPIPMALFSNDAGYYRSKLFNISGQNNSLLNAAFPLLMLATSLHNTANPPSLTALYHDLCHEIKAFETQIKSMQIDNKQSYQQNEILAARYILCAFIDETILTTQWGAKSSWQNQNLLDGFQKEMTGNDKFFLILEHCMLDAASHIDLLELIYICLSLGYAGKYRNHKKGNQILSEIIDTVYALIQQQNGEIEKNAMLHYQPVHQKQQIVYSWLTLGISICISLLVILSVYFGFDYLLASKISNFYQTLQHS